MFKDTTITRLVMAKVKAKIAAKQRAYDEGVKTIDTNCDKELKAVETKRVTEKTDLADKLVADILA